MTRAIPDGQFQLLLLSIIFLASALRIRTGAARCITICCGRWVVDVKGSIGRGADRDDARAEFDPDGHIVGVGESSFAEADGQAGLAGTGVTYDHDLAYIMPWERRWC